MNDYIHDFEEIYIKNKLFERTRRDLNIWSRPLRKKKFDYLVSSLIKEKI